MIFPFFVILIPFCTVHLYIYNNEAPAFKGMNLVLRDKHVWRCHYCLFSSVIRLECLFLSTIWLVWIALCRHYSILVRSVNYYHFSIPAVSVQLWGTLLLWVSSSQQCMEWTQNWFILLSAPGASTVTVLVTSLKKSKIPAPETGKCVTERDRDLRLLLSWQDREPVVQRRP